MRCRFVPGIHAALEAMVEFYDRGGIDNPEKSPRLAPPGLSAPERATPMGR